jgi:predicted metal-dependent hydrolase
MDVLDKELKEFQLKLEAILKEFLEQGRIEVYGNLKIMVTSFDKAGRIAFLKGNTIYVSVKARGYPDFVLRYIIAHELAHLAIKRHTWRFWKIVGIIYPEYEKGREELLEIARGELVKRNRRLKMGVLASRERLRYDLGSVRMTPISGTKAT